MAMLALIWWLSAALAVMAIVWMAWLILARLMDEHAQARRHQGRQQLQGAFMAIVRGQAGSAPAARVWRRPGTPT